MSEKDNTIKEFDIFAKLNDELDAFDREKIKITDVSDPALREGILSSSKTLGYNFSQKEMVTTIDMYTNDQFKTGRMDEEGQRKFFLNVVNFRRDVARHKTDLDIKDAIFIPTNNYVWAAFFASKDFRKYAKDEKLGKVWNSLNNDRTHYGHCVAKKVNKKVEKVPFKTIVWQQDAKNIYEAEYVTFLHVGMTKYEMDNMKGWDTDQLDMQPFDTDTVYERYGFMPEDEFMRLQGKTGGDPNKVIDTLGIYILKRTMKDNKLEISGAALFIEKIDRTKMLWESRWEHVEGRMMGRGEVEKQVEAQVARNYHINTRRKQSLWSGKKVFASNTDEVPKNLVKDVKNGQVLKLGANGQITQVDMTTKSLAEIGNDEQIWEQNSNQRAFTFEVATGEALPSGTAFRLGVILTNAVESYFGLKREEFGFFIKDIVEEAVLPIFESQNKKHALLMSAGEDGFDELREVLVGIEKNKIMKNLILKNSAIPDPVVIEQIVRLRVEGKTELMLKIREDLYKNKEFKFDVVTTGEQLDVNSKIETYKTVFQILAGNPAAMNDPRIMRLLEKIVGLTGESLRAMLGTLKPLPQQRPETPATEGSVPQPDASNNKTSLNDLANVNAPDKTASKI